MTACGDITSYFIQPRVMRWPRAHLDSAARSFGFGFTPRPRTILELLHEQLFAICSTNVKFGSSRRVHRSSCTYSYLAWIDKRGVMRGCVGGVAVIVHRLFVVIIEYEVYSSLVNKFFGDWNNEEERVFFSLFRNRPVFHVTRETMARLRCAGLTCRPCSRVSRRKRTERRRK